MRYLILLAWGLLVTSCAAPQRVPVSEYQRVHYTCEKQAEDARADAIMKNTLYKDCMRAHGWSK